MVIVILGYTGLIGKSILNYLLNKFRFLGHAITLKSIGHQKIFLLKDFLLMKL